MPEITDARSAPVPADLGSLQAALDARIPATSSNAAKRHGWCRWLARWLLLAGLLITTVTAPATVLVPAGSLWKFLDTGTNAGSTWRYPSFDDTAWGLGPAPLGYDPEIPLATTVGYGPDVMDKFITTWFRCAFVVTNAADYRNLLLRVVRDDGIAVYLNGAEVLRDNLPAGDLSADTRAASVVEEGLIFHAFPFQGVLREGTNLLAVEIHQRDPTSSDILFDLELSCLVNRGPYLQMATPDSLLIRWRTTEPTDSVVGCGTNFAQIDRQFTDAVLTNEHQVRLTGLQPNTRYYYTVGTSNETLVGGTNLCFRTPPVTAQPTRIWVTGDTRSGDEWQQAVRDAYYRLAGSGYTDLWLLLGDNAGLDGSDEEFQRHLFDLYPEILQQTPAWPCIGNHETGVPTAPEDFPQLQIFSLPTQGEAGGVPSGTERYFSFNHGNLHFVVLDSVTSDLTTNGPMYAWLREDLRVNTQDWLIAYWHAPPYTRGTHDSDWEDDMIQMRTNFLPLLESQGVDLVLNGHSHVYERSFLLDGHYGDSLSLSPAMLKNGGDGRWEGSGPYCKPSRGPSPHEGAVCVVVGSSGLAGGGTLDHPVMCYSSSDHGSLVLDVDGQVLNARFLRENGQIDDHFTILKDVAGVGPVLRSSVTSAGELSLTWRTVPYRFYRVYRRSSLHAEWAPASLWLWATDRQMTWSEPLDRLGSAAFYRVQVAPE